MTALRILVTPLATSDSRTFRHGFLGSLSDVWSLVVMETTGMGGQYVPPEATVAYAEANVSGETLSEPRVVADGPAVIGSPLPLCSPSLATSPANAVLTEWAVASVRLIGPLWLPSSLWTAHGE